MKAHANLMWHNTQQSGWGDEEMRRWSCNTHYVYLTISILTEFVKFHLAWRFLFFWEFSYLIKPLQKEKSYFHLSDKWPMRNRTDFSVCFGEGCCCFLLLSLSLSLSISYTISPALYFSMLCHFNAASSQSSPPRHFRGKQWVSL